MCVLQSQVGVRLYSSAGTALFTFSVPLITRDIEASWQRNDKKAGCPLP